MNQTLAAILYYNSIGFMDTATIIALIEEYAGISPYQQQWLNFMTT
jgi:hypothetical protein